MDDRSKIQTVVAGEADESEDSEGDEEVREISAASANANTPVPPSLRPGLVVAGEASESDEEEIDTGQDLPTLKVNTDGRGDTGDLTRQLLREESHSPHMDSRHTDSDRPKYDTLLHKKLRDRNMFLRRHLVDSTAQMYVSASKDLHNTTQQLMKTQLVIQDVSHNMRLLTNDLFQVEDRIDIISSCNLLPDIYIQL